MAFYFCVRHIYICTPTTIQNSPGTFFYLFRYMKYLYPYECEKLKLSTPQELQAAIDGNRREGRRSSYGYDLSPGPTLIPSSHHPHLNGGLFNGKLGGSAAGGVFRNEQLIPSSLLKYSTMTENGWNQKDLLGMLSHNNFSCFEKKIFDLKTYLIYLPYLKKKKPPKVDGHSHCSTIFGVKALCCLNTLSLKAC